jgi:prepilin-type N-terminal cleavage/methylation domain-containing protein
MTERNRMMARNRQVANDDGFTLIELVVTILILAIIMGPLLASVVGGLISTQQSAQRTANSADQQVLASFFENDVQSATTVSVPAAGAAGCSATGTPVLQLNWVDPGDTGTGTTTNTIVYALNGPELDRVSCTSTGGAKTTSVVGAVSGTPVAMCTTAGTTAACGAAASKPDSVDMSVTAAGDTSGANLDTYIIQLSAARRVNA